MVAGSRTLQTKRLTITYYVLCGLIFVGFLFNTSPPPQIGPYSVRNVLLLLVLATGFFVPTALGAAIRVYSSKDVAVFMTLSVLMMLLGYIAASEVYYYTRLYPFDPYLQMPPPKPELSSKDRGNQTLRILALGGSTTENGDLPIETRYPERIGTLLKESAPRDDIVVMNAGRQWYTSKHSLINYIFELEPLKPQIVLIMHGINDLVRSCTGPLFARTPYRSDWSHFYGPSIHGYKPPTFEAYLFQQSIGLLYRRWFGAFRAEPWSEANEVNYNLQFYRSLPDFEHYMRRLVDVLKKDGALPILITQPSIYREKMTSEERKALWFGRTYCQDPNAWLDWKYPSPGSLGIALKAYNDVTRRIAHERNVMLIDADSQIPKTLEYFIDDVHYTPKGAQRLAYIVASEIADLGLLSQFRSGP
jgi:lysophospholipase L1-like esterase